MSCCRHAASDVAKGPELVLNSHELLQIDDALNHLDQAFQNSLLSFNELVTAVDNISRIYTNLGSQCSVPVQQRLQVFANEMRGLRRDGLYDAFLEDVMKGSILCFDNIKIEVEDAKKSLFKLNALTAEYEQWQQRINEQESEALRLKRAVSTDKEYQTNLKRRVETLAAADVAQQKLCEQVDSIKNQMNSTIVGSVANFCTCAYFFWTYLEKVIRIFGNSNGRPPHLQQMFLNYSAPHFTSL